MPHPINIIRFFLLCYITSDIAARPAILLTTPHSVDQVKPIINPVNEISKVSETDQADKFSKYPGTIDYAQLYSSGSSSKFDSTKIDGFKNLPKHTSFTRSESYTDGTKSWRLLSLLKYLPRKLRKWYYRIRHGEKSSSSEIELGFYLSKSKPHLVPHQNVQTVNPNVEVVTPKLELVEQETTAVPPNQVDTPSINVNPTTSIPIPEAPQQDSEPITQSSMLESTLDNLRMGIPIAKSIMRMSAQGIINSPQIATSLILATSRMLERPTRELWDWLSDTQNQFSLARRIEFYTGTPKVEIVPGAGLKSLSNVVLEEPAHQEAIKFLESIDNLKSIKKFLDKHNTSPKLKIPIDHFQNLIQDTNSGPAPSLERSTAASSSHNGQLDLESGNSPKTLIAPKPDHDLRVSPRPRIGLRAKKEAATEKELLQSIQEVYSRLPPADVQGSSSRLDKPVSLTEKESKSILVAAQLLSILTEEGSSTAHLSLDELAQRIGMAIPAEPSEVAPSPKEFERLKVFLKTALQRFSDE